MNQPYCITYAGRFGYSTKAMNPPPAETPSNVIQFSLTEGCSHHKCTFCDMYGQQDYSIKTEKDFKEHVDLVISHLHQNEHSSLKEIDRLFIGGGNALSAPADLLNTAAQYALKKVYRATGHVPRRLTVYGNTNDILRKGDSDLHHLRCGGTCGDCSMGTFGEKRGVDLIYWGIESGNVDVLEMAGKGYVPSKIIKAFNLLNENDIKSSVMIIPGLGGIKYSERHIRDTVDILNRGKPGWITFIGINASKNTPYSKLMLQQEEQGINKSLTPIQIAEQTAKMIEGINFSTTIGVYGSDIHHFGSNPFPIGHYDTMEVEPFQIAKLIREQIKKSAKPKINKLEKGLFRDFFNY